MATRTPGETSRRSFAELDPPATTIAVDLPCYAAFRQMQSVTNANFGPLVAYLLPGATVLLGLTPFSPLIRSWFAVAPNGTPTIGGFLFLTVASMGVGMTVSAIRWLVIDSLHRFTGLTSPPQDFSRLGPNVEAFGLLIQIHYLHYLWFSNELIALAIAYGCYRVNLGATATLSWLDVLFVLLEVVFWAASRDTLTRYHLRSRQLLGGASIAPNATPAPAARRTRQASVRTSGTSSATE